MRSGIIIPMLFLKSLSKRYIFQLTKCEHNGGSESIHSDGRNFSSVKSQQIFYFFKPEDFISGVL